MPTEARPLDARFYDSARTRRTLDHAWQLVHEMLPEGWTLEELSRMGTGVPGVTAEWYAAAYDPARPAGEHVEGTGASAVSALLALARALHGRRHRIGRPPKPAYVPPAPAKRREAIAGYRSPNLDSVAMLRE